MKINYKNCEINAYREEGLDGQERIYVSAVDNETDYIIMDEFYWGYMTVWKVLNEGKLVVDSYRGNEEEWVDE